jgi:chromosome segregation ATPase
LIDGKVRQQEKSFAAKLRREYQERKGYHSQQLREQIEQEWQQQNQQEIEEAQERYATAMQLIGNGHANAEKFLSERASRMESFQSSINILYKESAISHQEWIKNRQNELQRYEAALNTISQRINARNSEMERQRQRREQVRYGYTPLLFNIHWNHREIERQRSLQRIARSKKPQEHTPSESTATSQVKIPPLFGLFIHQCRRKDYEILNKHTFTNW